MATLDTLIAKVERKIGDEKLENELRTLMSRVDTIAVLQDIATDLHSIKGDLKFNLSITGDEHCTIVVKKNGTTQAAGSKVIAAGDTLKVIATFSEGYQLKTLKSNGVDIENNSSFSVVDDVAIVGTSEAIPTP